MDTELMQEDPIRETGKKDTLYEFFATFELLAFAAAVVLLFFSFIARITVVDGGSMEETLIHGDKLIVSDLFYTPSRGDIVIVQSPTVNGGEAIVKRVIAVEGDTVMIREDGIYVNGERLNETDGSLGYTIGKYSYHSMPEQLIKEGNIFLLGDHRSVSYDSRSFGQVDADAVLGKVLFRISPLSKFGTVN